MSIQGKLIRASVLAFAIAAAIPAQADTAVKVEAGKHHYVYYRDHDIYYGPETKTYYWLENGKWQSGSVLPSTDLGYVKDGGQTIELDTERPYERHDYVVSHYKNNSPQGESTTTERSIATRADGSTTSTTTTTTTKHNYVYYADHDIYYGPDNKTYYWMVDGQWKSGTELPVADRLFITSGGVTIELDTDRPYTRHEYVTAHYKHKHERKDD